MHLIILAILAFGLTENLNYDFNFWLRGGVCISYVSYRPAAKYE